jgi:hypothetical protein
MTRKKVSERPGLEEVSHNDEMRYKQWNLVGSYPIKFLNLHMVNQELN